MRESASRSATSDDPQAGDDATGTTRGSVHVVEDDPSMRQALTSILEREGYAVDVFESMEAFVASPPATSEPAVLVLDVRLPGESGLALRDWLTHRDDPTPVIFISGDSHPQEIVDGLKGGAEDFLIKPFRLQSLLDAVKVAMERARRRKAEAGRRIPLRERWSRLTPREKEVCTLMLQGMSNREIAARHGSVPGTVKLHRARVLEKMEVDSLSALFQLADGYDLAGWLKSERGEKP